MEGKKGVLSLIIDAKKSIRTFTNQILPDFLLSIYYFFNQVARHPFLFQYCTKIEQKFEAYSIINNAIMVMAAASARQPFADRPE